MTAAVSHQLKLTGDQLRVLGIRAGIQDFSAVLVQPRHSFVDRREVALDLAARELLRRNLIADDNVHPDLAPVLQALQRPDRELAMRLVSAEGVVRVNAIRRGTLCLLVRQVGDDVGLRILGHSVELRDVVSALVAALPRASASDVPPVRAPLLTVSESLSGTNDSVQLADRIRALGVEARTAMMLGSALAARRAFVEIVYSALSAAEERICRGPAAVGVFYTNRGRIVGVPGASPTGQLWTTLKPGSDHAIANAIVGLIELADEGWHP